MMIRTLNAASTASVTLLLLAGCGSEPAPATSRDVARYEIADFMGTTSHTGASFSPDGSSILLSHDGTGVFNAYAVPVAGGEPTALTSSSSDAIFAIGYFNDDERFLYTADQGGNELNHLYVRAPDGTVTDLTPGENLKAQFAGWSGDRLAFYVQTNERDPQAFDVYRYEVADGYPRRMVFRNEDGLLPASISPNGRHIALIRARATNDNDLFVEDLETGERVDVTPHEGTVTSSPADFSADGRWLYYTTDEGSEYQRLMRLDMESGAKETVLAPDWDIMFASFSRDGRYLVVGVNEDARTRLSVYEADDMRPVSLPDMPDASITSVSFSKDGSHIALYASSSRSPGDLFVMPISGGDPVRLTRSLNPAIDPADLVDAQVVRFASYDGVEIPGILYKPHSASADAKVPALVWVHGGPGGQSRVGYSDLMQYLVNHGYAVYAINNRGSSGYGKTFFSMDDRQHGEADLADVVASKQMLIETGYVDPERVGIIGGSYGGYMVAAALAFEPEVFDVGVDIFGVTNWLRTLESIPPWWGAARDALYSEMGDPSTDRDRLHRISPLFHAANITKPLIVLQGANDPRVLQVESDELVDAVRANGVPVEYIVFENEGHGFLHKENEIRGYSAILSFLDEHLKGQRAIPVEVSGGG
jgi:dipeptidyl aminopeptidase/acylaminoacyl peptidase